MKCHYSPEHKRGACNGDGVAVAAVKRIGGELGDLVDWHPYCRGCVDALVDWRISNYPESPAVMAVGPLTLVDTNRPESTL